MSLINSLTGLLAFCLNSDSDPFILPSLIAIVEGKCQIATQQDIRAGDMEGIKNHPGGS